MEDENFLILVRGLPGSGKTTFAKAFSEHAIAADDFFTDEDGAYHFEITQLSEAHNKCQKDCETMMLSQKTPIAVHNTFTTEKEMQPYYDLAEKHNYKVISLIMENRHNGKNVHNVPLEVLQKMKNRFEIKLYNF